MKLFISLSYNLFRFVVYTYRQKHTHTNTTLWIRNWSHIATDNLSVLLVWATSSRKIEMKFVLQVNKHRLTESDFLDDVMRSRWQPPVILRRKVLPSGKCPSCQAVTQSDQHVPKTAKVPGQNRANSSQRNIKYRTEVLKYKGNITARFYHTEILS